MTEYSEMEPPVRAEIEPFDGSEDSDNPADYEENGDSEMSLEGIVASLDDYSGTLVSGVDPASARSTLVPSTSRETEPKDQPKDQPPDLPPKQRVRNGDVTVNGHSEEQAPVQSSPSERPVVPPRRNRKNFRFQGHVCIIYQLI